MNTAQYNKCVDQHADGLYRFVLSIVCRRDEAEDIMQESFTRLWENRKRVEPGKEKSYLFTIAHNLSISSLRKNKRSTQDPHLHIAQFASADSQYDNMTELLWEAMEKLSDNAKAVIVLRDWEGYSYEEIAEITGNTLAQVKVSIHRARGKIKESLSNEYQQVIPAIATTNS